MEIYMIELRGKAVADAHKEILQEKMTGLESGTITMAVLLVGDDHGANMYADFMEKRPKILAMVSCVSNYQVQLRIKRYTMH